LDELTNRRDATLFQELLERPQVRPQGWVTMSWPIYLEGLTAREKVDRKEAYSKLQGIERRVTK